MKSRGKRRKKKAKQQDELRRCGDPSCGRLVKVPANPRGLGCPKCGEPLSRARAL
jgi:predicted RNA-binding Zn-ribbon protein involved in translation (DUF1610 family)